jgi:hypothetical protein
MSRRHTRSAAERAAQRVDVARGVHRADVRDERPFWSRQACAKRRLYRRTPRRAPRHWMSTARCRLDDTADRALR